MVYTRRDIWDLETEQAWHPITRAYALAVHAMRTEYPASDPRSWTYQAAIHAVPEGTPLSPGWSQCEHAVWFFLPWHRMYLFYFESIVRSIVRRMGGPEEWALPYWNYDGGGDKNTIPLPFRDEAPMPDLPGIPNPLFVGSRNEGINDGRDPLEPEITSPAAALASQWFSPPNRPTFGGGRVDQGGPFRDPGQLEITPHNVVHTSIGGLMGDPPTAGLDPIFWLHHANIDRLWNRWAANPNHTPPPANAWRDQGYGFFDEQGTPRSKTSKDVLSTVTQLDYQYDDDSLPFREIAPVPSEPLPPRPPAELIAASEEPTRLSGRPVSVPVAVDEKASVRRLQNEIAPARRIVLSVEHVDADVNPGVVYGVYLEGLTARPPVHVGNVSLFGIERIHERQGVQEAHDLRLDFDVTDAVAGQADRLSELKVRFAPIRLDTASRRRVAEEATEIHPPIRVGRVSFSLD